MITGLASIQFGHSGTEGLRMGMIKSISEEKHRKIKHFIDKEVH